MRWPVLAFVLSAAGCSGYWGRRPLDQATPVTPDQPVWIWTSGGVEKWHDVVVTEDSVTGIQYGMPLKCPSCRRSIPRSQVDSMRLGFHTFPEKVTKGVGFALLVLAVDVVVEGGLCYLLHGKNGRCD